ncbi:hypothetical protein J4233_01600 [Candidatus Pacearchaeota archaeon]|nr:hypothetical protein [Candidatus Pacearchaeota archaeon]
MEENQRPGTNALEREASLIPNAEKSETLRYAPVRKNSLKFKSNVLACVLIAASLIAGAYASCRAYVNYMSESIEAAVTIPISQ